MVEVGVQPDRMILLQHVAEIVCDSLRHNYRSSGADSYDFYVRNLSQFADDVFKSVVLYQESVSAGEQNVSYLRSSSYVIDTCVDIFS